VRQQQHFERIPMQLLGPDELSLRSLRLPAPWHLLGGLLCARGLPVVERWAVAAMMLRLRLSRWRLHAGETVEDLLDRYRQPASLRCRLWHPLVIATMNTQPSRACAQTFANVLRDSLGSDAKAADFLLPTGTLSQLFPQQVASWIRDRGASLRCGVTVRALLAHQDCWLIQTSAGQWLADQVIFALPAHASARLLERMSDTHPTFAGLANTLARLDYDSIATVYLAWPAGSAPRLPRCLMLREGPEQPGQWLFDRGVHGQERIAAVVISVADGLTDLTPVELAERVARQIVSQLGVSAPIDATAVIDRRATFRCTPDRPKLHADTLAPRGTGEAHHTPTGLILAGDYVYPDYPATLESAVRSGIAAAAHALASG
jgi:squalene-associated FAD-dependent desaturase